MRTTLPPERPPKSGSWNCGGDTSQQLSDTTHPPTTPASLTPTRQGKRVVTCSDTVHGIRSPEAFFPRDRLLRMDWREISPSRHTCGAGGAVQTGGRPPGREPSLRTSSTFCCCSAQAGCFHPRSDLTLTHPFPWKCHYCTPWAP